MDDSTASAPAAFERLHLDLRGTRFTIERDDLMNLPESVLLCLFPNGLALNNNAGHGRHLGYSSADEDEEEEEEDVYIVDFDPACLSYVLAFFKTAQDAFYGTETQQGKFRGGPLAAARLSAYLQSQSAAATADFGGIDGFGAQSGWANQNPLLTKQAVIVLREELEYFAIPPHSTQETASAVAAGGGGEAEETRLAKEADGEEHVLASDALGRLKRDAGRALLERRSIFTALQRNVNKENNMAEQHLIDMLCMSGFEPDDTWGFRAVEPSRCSLTSISLVLLKTGITHSSSEGTDEDEDEDDEDRDGAEILADMRIDQNQLNTAQKLLLFWRKPARKCWWDGVDVVVPLPLGSSAATTSPAVATEAAQTPETVAAAAAAQSDPSMTGISEAEVDLLANGRGRKVRVWARRVWTLELSLI
ncbi:hypothetical protein CF327_g2415 [Tilletia walkeri]|nr:hypothetical protein CF327_g2415 [Tilletia walkeri]